MWLNQTNQKNQINLMNQMLRQIAPAGFLTQTFAVDWSASTLNPELPLPFLACPARLACRALFASI